MIMDDSGPFDGAPAARADDEFAREALGSAKPVVHSGRRQTIRRTLLAVAGCVLLAVVVLAATGAAGQLWRQARFSWLRHNAPTITRAAITPGSAGRRALPDGWRQQPLKPPPTPDVFYYFPASDDLQTWYGCSAAHIDNKNYDSYVADGPLAFWYTHDAGQRWTRVPIPQVSGGSCNLGVAADAPQRLALTSQRYGSTPPQNAACSRLSLFLSDDGGAHWHVAPTLPDPPIQPGQDTRCTVIPWPTARHLYLLYTYSVMIVTKTSNTKSSVAQDATSLVRSDDGGRTWKRLDANIPPGAEDAFYPHLLDDGETLLLPVAQYEPPANGSPAYERSWLWVSRDAGDSWQPLASIDGFLIQAVLTPEDTRSLAPAPAHPLYLLSEANLPSRYLRIQIAQMTDSHHWSPLPPLPIAGASLTRPGISSVLTTTPSGRLLVFGLGPEGQIPASETQQVDEQQFDQQWLWEWDPVASRWTLLTPALDAPWPTACGNHCWVGSLQNAGDANASLWVVEYDRADTSRWNLFRVPYVP